VRPALKSLFLWIVLLVCMTATLAGQIPASFRVPVLGYVLDREIHAIRPVVGIPGNSRIGSPIDFGVPVSDVAFLGDQQYAVVVSPQEAEALFVDLEDPAHVQHIAGVSSSISSIRASADGTKAALYDSHSGQIFVVGGIPTALTVLRTIDVSLEGTGLTRFAITNDGMSALLAYRGEESDTLYTWEPTTGRRFVTGAARIADIAFVGADAVVTDSGSDQVLLIRGVRDQAAPALVADFRDGVNQPGAIAVSSRNEIYIGVAEAVLVMDATGHLLRRVPCGCTITTMTPLRDAALQLTDQLDRPLWVLDTRTDPERILFVPALSAEMRPAP